MIDPVPVGYIELNDAMLRRAADISDLEYQERVPQFRKYWEQVHGVTFKVDEPKQTRQPRNEVEIENQERENRNRDAARLWRKREFAIYDLYAALCQGSLIALVREPASGQMFKLTGIDWRGASYWRDIIIGGFVKAGACEQIERHNRRRVLLKAEEFDAWLKKRVRCRPEPAETDCGEWLEGLMRENPERRPKPKSELRKEAISRFGVSGRGFDRIWDDKRKITGANWGEPGAPTKQPE